MAPVEGIINLSIPFNINVLGSRRTPSRNRFRASDPTYTVDSSEQHGAKTVCTYGSSEVVKFSEFKSNVVIFQKILPRKKGSITSINPNHAQSELMQEYTVQIDYILLFSVC